VKAHSTIRITLAQAAGVENRAWTVMKLGNAVSNKQDYLSRVQVAVSRLHKCGATWCKTLRVHEVFQGKTVWQGDVEVFDLYGHPKAKRCYAWSHFDGANYEHTRYVAMLEIPPVDSAQKAVQVQIVKDRKGIK
jgi:hypothetical protein